MPRFDSPLILFAATGICAWCRAAEVVAMRERAGATGAQRAPRLRFSLFIVAVMASCAWVPGATAQSVKTAGHPAQRRAGSLVPANEPQVCDGCVPPLTYQGGLVLTGSGGLSVTPIY